MVGTRGNYDQLPSQLHQPVLCHETWQQYQPLRSQPEISKPKQDSYQPTKPDNNTKPTSSSFQPAPHYGSERVES